MEAAQIGDTVRDIPAQACIVGRGGVLAMHPLRLHASSKMTGDKTHRVLHIEYTDRFDFGNGVRLRVA